MNKTAIKTSEAPAPIGPYNQAIAVGNLLFVSGQIALDAATGEFLNNDLATETHQVMRNLKAILNEAGINFSHVVKSTIFLSDMSLFAAVNDIYASYFDQENPSVTALYPARETVAVKGLPKDARVEISMIAAL